MIYPQLLIDLQLGKDVVLATIISRNGSAPRMAGAQMLIYADGQIFGTIGGGQLEAKTITAAKSVFDSHQAKISKFTMTGKDAASSDMICGGSQDVLLEFIPHDHTRLIELISHLIDLTNQRKKAWLLTRLSNPSGQSGPLLHAVVIEDAVLDQDQTEPRMEFRSEDFGGTSTRMILQLPNREVIPTQVTDPVVIHAADADYFIQPLDVYGTVYIFGAGHVSQQLALVTKLVGFRTVVIDDRPEFANRMRFPGVDEIIVCNEWDGFLSKLQLDPSSFLVIVTRGHLDDHIVLSQALKTNAVYIGMIGSKRKVETIYKALIENEGYTREQLTRVHAPIGLPIEAESPEEIAVSITAELIAVRAKLHT